MDDSVVSHFLQLLQLQTAKSYPAVGARIRCTHPGFPFWQILSEKVKANYEGAGVRGRGLVFQANRFSAVISEASVLRDYSSPLHALPPTYLWSGRGDRVVGSLQELNASPRHGAVGASLTDLLRCPWFLCLWRRCFLPSLLLDPQNWMGCWVSHIPPPLSLLSHSNNALWK